ncbi:MAG: hypothetical protein LKG19_08395 [Saprospiraceae bacterium]|jgi:CRP-like cAMP-binding protein|nr:hypothetical protein [Saprospiraceae bacterium]
MNLTSLYLRRQIGCSIMDQNFTHFINHLRKFGHLNDLQAKEITEYFTLDLIPAGEYYLQNGKISHRMGFITQGVMRYCNVGKEGELLTCYFVAENDLAGDIESFARQIPSTLHLQAITDTLIISISRSQNEILTERFPDFISINALMAQVFVTSLANQRAFLLNSDGKAKYDYFIEHYAHIMNRVPLGMVASYLGIKQQSLSRLRAQF